MGIYLTPVTRTSCGFRIPIPQKLLFSLTFFWHGVTSSHPPAEKRLLLPNPFRQIFQCNRIRRARLLADSVTHIMPHSAGRQAIQDNNLGTKKQIFIPIFDLRQIPRLRPKNSLRIHSSATCGFPSRHTLWPRHEEQHRAPCPCGRLTRREPAFGPEVQAALNARPKIKKACVLVAGSSEFSGVVFS